MSTQSISYKRHRFSPEIIAHAVWLYCRFNMSLREVEELLLERGIDVSYERSGGGLQSLDPRLRGVYAAVSPNPAISGISMRLL